MRALVLLLAAFALPTMGCIIVPRHHHHVPRPHVVRPACPPGTHWDGYVCRPNHHHHGRR